MIKVLGDLKLLTLPTVILSNLRVIAASQNPQQKVMMYLWQNSYRHMHQASVHLNVPLAVQLASFQ